MRTGVYAFMQPKLSDGVQPRGESRGPTGMDGVGMKQTTDTGSHHIQALCLRKITRGQKAKLHSHPEKNYIHIREEESRCEVSLYERILFCQLCTAVEGEIIGGQEARPHSHPYMAYLQVQTAGQQGACGGFLVREDFVMTAAHCWGCTINVILGAHNVSRQERTQQRIPVLRAIRHPEYSEENLLNDIMLLKLQSRARQNRFVRPVALPRSQARLRPGTLCSAAGWGQVSQSRGGSDILRDVQLRVQTDQSCSGDFGNVYKAQTEICIGD
ncbi:cathepsin G-like [Saccopteryx bilineata]|uniref:cathepsin G-like n=1 Tax=Saccopteryx bilineata TaxID=59482 RepID=UPI00338E2440